MLKVSILFVLLLSTIASDTVLSKACICSEILNEKDCLRIKCSYSNGKCLDRDVETYCQLTTIIAKCPVIGCALYQNTCEPFAGCAAYQGSTYEICQKISDECTSDGTSCVPLADCNTYKNKTSCVIDGNNHHCYFDATDTTTPCKNVITCVNLPTTLKTDASCRSQIQTCTVNDTATGCKDSGTTCADQKTKLQCVTNLDQTIQCIWNDTASNCKDFTCANGTGTTYEECQKYKNTCTLAESKTACQDLQDCPIYQSAETCKQGTSYECIWNTETKTCSNKTCASASDDYINHTLCTKYISTCTVDDDGLGCKDRQATCGEYFIKSQCVKDINNKQCYWNTTLLKCVNYDCDNADVITYTSDNCNKFLNTCTSDTGNTKCQSKACIAALTQSLCTQLNNCVWQSSACFEYTCPNAPTSYATDTACDSYKKGCKTTGAGCTDSVTCTSFKTSSACTSSKLDTKCSWVNSACKVMACTDITGFTHASCNSQLDTCTTDGSKCIAEVNKCSNYTAQVSCIHSQEGPCVWIQGACYLFTSCSTLPGQTQEFCQAGSKKCTTDGTKCIPITTCAKTIQTGCYVGTDGECVRNLDSTNQTICEKYSKCSQLNFTTHFQCYREKSTCTVASTKKTCMDLQATCSSYTIQDHCQLTTSGSICQWDTSTQKCRDQVCTDILKTTYSDCQAVNPNCSTDSSKCIVMIACSAYTSQTACKMGTDGQCLYDSTTQKCRSMLCTDITDVKQCTTLANCYADTNKCVSKQKCSGYTTQTSCAFDGTDGICTWSGTACSLMTKCEDANSFESACRKYSTVCKWTPKPSNGGASSCKALTCSNANSGSSCNPLISFDKTYYQVCADIQLTCQAASISDLTEDTCFTNSAGTYYWDTITTKCVACNGSSTTNTTVIVNSQQLFTIGLLLVASLLN